MKNNSKYIKYFVIIILGILIVDFFLSLSILRNKNIPENDDTTYIKSSDGTITMYEWTLYGSFAADGSVHDEQEYFEWSISTIYGPGLTWYMMNDTELWAMNALPRQWRTLGNFSYTELLSDEEASASGTFYPPYLDTWWFVAMNHYVGINCSVAYTDDWMDDFINVDAPTSSSSWEANTFKDITWTWGGDFDYVDIDLYHDDNFLRNIATNAQNNGSYLWRIPDDISLFDDLYQINISNSDFADTWGISDPYFEIKELRSINVTSPYTSNSWETGTTQSISWTSTGYIANVKIELFKGGILEMEIISSTQNDGFFPWNIPPGLDNSTQYQIKITDVSDSSIYDISDYFEIYTEPTISEPPAIPGYGLMILIGTFIACGIVIYLLNKKKRASEISLLK